MKRIVNFIIGLIVIGIIGYGVYAFFFDCEKTVTYFDRNFTLEKMDYAKIEDEAIVKLVKINDNRCLEESCEREGQIEVKVLVLNENRVTYVTLSTLSEKSKEIPKLKYLIELVEASDKDATFKLSRLED